MTPRQPATPGVRLDAALGYAGRGWPVFPCRPGTRRPATVHGFKDASTNPQTIAAWWRRWPTANLGLATGQVAGLVVVDIDPDHGGRKTLAMLEARLGPLPPGPTVRTPSGGEHRYFAYPTDGGRVPCSAGRLGPGLDVRADGGYVIVPPGRARRKSDGAVGAYTWLVAPDDAPLPPLPAAWLAALRADGSGGDGLEQADAPPAAGAVRDRFGEGTRNAALAAVAGLLRRLRLTPDAIEAGLLAINDILCEPPLSPPEVRRIARGMRRYRPGPGVAVPAAGRSPRGAAPRPIVSVVVTPTEEASA